MEDDRSCPLCGGKDIVKPYTTAEFPIWRCSCGMVFLYPHPSAAELKAIYCKQYYQSWGVADDDEGKPRLMKHLTFSSQLTKLAQYANRGRVLDVGCATGFFLEVARDAGWDVHGVELSEFSARLAQKKFGDRIFHGTLEQACLTDAQFDAVTLSDLIEHVPEPFSFLAEVRRILHPSGVLMIVTPNVASLSARMMGAKWSHYKAEHLHYFSPQTMENLLIESGFTLFCCESAPKYLNLAYVMNQFNVYRHPLVTSLLKRVALVVPDRLKQMNFPVYCGEMLVLAKKSR